MAFTIVARSCLFIGPLPIGNVWLIDAELVGVIFAGDLLVEQGLANTGAGDAETGYPIDSVNGQAEAVSLVADGQFKWCINVALFLIAAHVDVVLTGAAVGQAVDQPRVGVKVEDHRLVPSKQSFEFTIGHAVWMFGVRYQL